MRSTLHALRRAASWALLIETPLALLAALSTFPMFYRTVPAVLAAHLPGIMLLDTLGLCCGLGGGRVITDAGPYLEPPVLVSVLILAAANALVFLLAFWLLLLLAGRRRHVSLPHAAA